MSVTRVAEGAFLRAHPEYRATGLLDELPHKQL